MVIAKHVSELTAKEAWLLMMSTCAIGSLDTKPGLVTLLYCSTSPWHAIITPGAFGDSATMMGGSAAAQQGHKCTFFICLELFTQVLYSQTPWIDSLMR